jgi:hypothetical protein
MKRFVKYFCRLDYRDLENVINEYARTNRLLIISISSQGDHSMWVLFERM